MKVGRYIGLVIISLLIFISCGPGFKTSNSKVKRIKNVYDVTSIKKSREQYGLEKQRKKHQRKVNSALWKKQMKNRYNE